MKNKPAIESLSYYNFKGFKYDIKIAGSFKNLFLVEDRNAKLPLEANNVEVQCKAIGLNMHDLGVASGNFDGDNLSNEFTGVVSRVGEGVVEFTPGDRVFGIAQGNFGNFIRVGKHTVRKIPTRHSFEAIASMPLVYATAIYALQHLARLREGERVLIHSASGGLGIAAIVIAQMLKAEVFATVGNDSKRRFLIESFKIPEERILLSDSVKTDEIMRASDGIGMNVILSSANNETLQELWGSIAPLGRFIDVGRMQVLRHGKLEMDVFSRNATFASFDLELVSRQNPTLLSALMDEMVDLLSNGKIYPIMPLTKFPISELAEAMSFMAKRVHMGKIVLSLQEPETQLTIRKTSNEVTFSPNGSYLLVGCLGGLGRSLTLWMVERGATHLVFLSRSGTNNREAARFVQDLLNRGIDVSVVQGDVSVLADVERAISSAPKPIQGVVHAAMALCDVQFHTMPLSDFEKARNVKAHGAINLHKALENTSLDFFLMTSSFLATMGSATQAAYCAANAFLDSFAQYRRQQGLPALSVAFDVLSDVGFASINRQLIQNMKRNGFSATTELELRNLYPKLFTPHHTSQRALEPESSHIILGLDPHKLKHDNDHRYDDAFWMGDPRFSIITRALTDDFDGGSVRHSHQRNARDMQLSIRDRLQETPVADHSSLIRQIFTEKLAALLFISTDQMDANVPLSHFGLDSMIASEMRHWCLQNFGRGGSSLALLEPTTTIDSLTMAVLTTSTFSS